MPRKYTIKDPEAYRKSRLAGLDRIRELGKGNMGGSKKGVPHAHHINNPSAGEKRTGMFMLTSSSEVINTCARARGVTNLAFMKELTDKLKRSKEFKHLFARKSKRCSGVAGLSHPSTAD